MTAKEVLGSLRVHESRLIERDNREEEQALLSKASKMTKKTDRGQMIENYFINMNTRVLSEPILLLLLFLIHQLEKLSIY